MVQIYGNGCGGVSVPAIRGRIKKPPEPAGGCQTDGLASEPPIKGKRMDLRRVMVGLAVMLLAPVWLWGENTPEHVDQTLFPDADTRMCSADTEPKGAADEFQSGFIGDGTKAPPNEYRILMHFDLSTLKKTPVRCAMLRICNKNNTRGTNIKFMRVHAMYRPWTEKNATWFNNQPEDAWINKGGDFLPTCYGAASIPSKWGGEEEHYYSFDITGLVQGWQNGAIKNHGLVILHDAGSDNYQRFHSKEFPNNRPMLWISYSNTITTPDQTVMAPNDIPPFGPPPDYKPHITTTALNAGNVGVPYSAKLSAKGGERPYKWELVAGSKLPEGFTLSATGELTGTGTGPCNLQFRVKCNSADRKNDQTTLKLVIQGEAAPVKVESPKPDEKKPDDPAAGNPALPQDDG